MTLISLSLSFRLEGSDIGSVASTMVTLLDTPLTPVVTDTIRILVDMECICIALKLIQNNIMQLHFISNHMLL